MTWLSAHFWANNLNYFDSVRNVTYSDRRLPTMVDTGTRGQDLAFSGTDAGYNVQTVSGSTVYSEMAHMYFNNLGLKSQYSPTGTEQADWGIFGNGTINGTDSTPAGQNDVGLIDNLQASYYWYGLGYAPNSDFAWSFSPGVGGQAINDVSYNSSVLYAWAVRPGDVAAVPEAQTYALMLAGLGLVGVVTRRRRG